MFHHCQTLSLQHLGRNDVHRGQLDSCAKDKLLDRALKLLKKAVSEKQTRLEESGRLRPGCGMLWK